MRRKQTLRVLMESACILEGKRDGGRRPKSVVEHEGGARRCDEEIIEKEPRDAERRNE